MSPSFDPAKASDKVKRAARRDLEATDHPAVVVDSPPGAGKSTFVVETARRLARDHGQVPIVAQTNAQADDLVVKLLEKGRQRIGRLTGSSSKPELPRDPRLDIKNKIDDLAECDVVVATAAKWAYVGSTIEPYAVGIVDEAYQMRSDQLLYVAQIFDRALFVGDPGQLDPFSPIDDTRWRGYADGPINPAVATVIHNHPDTPRHVLPVSWRLPATCAPLVSDAFYPNNPFRSGTTRTDRKLTARGLDGSPIDEVIRTATKEGWGYLELPARVAPPTDREAIDTVAQVGVRLLEAKLRVRDERSDQPRRLRPADIAIGVAHRNQRAAVRVALDHLASTAGIDADDITVDTANRLQGREYEIVVVLHPLSGRAAASEFHLETGRLCVLLSRHRQACIVVGRAGIDEVLDAHPADMPIWLGAPIAVPDGWEANQLVLERLLPNAIPSP